jgi:hypothetical protein
LRKPGDRAFLFLVLSFPRAAGPDGGRGLAAAGVELAAVTAHILARSASRCP